jgi:pyruvate dehydrogenase E1 component alpha subunit
MQLFKSVRLFAGCRFSSVTVELPKYKSHRFEDNFLPLTCETNSEEMLQLFTSMTL